MILSRRSMIGGLGGSMAVALVPAIPANASEIKSLEAEIKKALEGDGVLRLPPGEIVTRPLVIRRNLSIIGTGTRIRGSGEGPILTVTGAQSVVLRGLALSGADGVSGEALLRGEDVGDLTIEDCSFSDAAGTAVHLEACGGRVSDNRLDRIGGAGIFARDSRGLEISGNRLADIGNNGIQVWSSEPREDGTRVTGNQIARVKATAGGTGQNGNGINVFRAGNVIVSGNRISDCAFSAVRNNAGSACLIASNSISRTGEVAIYCEFGFLGAVVTGNMLEDVALGISITNFNEGGRLAAVNGNVIRNVTGGGSLESTRGIGIAAEADTAITGNVIEGATDTGIALGWGGYGRDLSATGNVIRDCGIGIGFSVASGAGPVLIANNRISAARNGNIMGTDHGTPVTSDLAVAGAVAPGGMISGNLID
ncbi:MAG: TIGR03808 family TAT-translocated repetitive protein [Hyphomicrobiales bacterium]